MRKTICAAVMVAGFAGAVNAGGVSEPVMEPEVVVAETAASSNGGILVPLLLLLVLAAAVSGGGSAPLPPT